MLAAEHRKEVRNEEGAAETKGKVPDVCPSDLEACAR